jgi:DNA polymerase sigma
MDTISGSLNIRHVHDLNMDNKSKGNDRWLGNKLSLFITQIKSSSDKSFELAKLNCTPFRKINRT